MWKRLQVKSAFQDKDLGVEVISFDDPVNTVPSANLVSGEYLASSTENHLTSPLVNWQNNSGTNKTDKSVPKGISIPNQDHGKTRFDHRKNNKFDNSHIHDRSTPPDQTDDTHNRNPDKRVRHLKIGDKKIDKT
jgi:hypothetical protein